MEIIINGQQAYLKKNTSFEYISENPLFTGSDSYTLTIAFPLKDCTQNIRIFGHLHRMDVEKNKVVFNCDIRDKDFFKSGSIVITQISEVEVKTQFLEGRSEQNFDDTFDNVFLNQLNLGYPDSNQRSTANNDIYEVWDLSYPDSMWVPLPWVNNTSGNLQNEVIKNEYDELQWGENKNGLTFQPFLLYILNKICEVIGYQGNFCEIERSVWKDLLICNTLPAAWRVWNFAAAMPHWSLTEFFEELEKLMKGEFTINHKAKTICFEFSHKIAHNTPDVHIEKVVSKYTVEVSRENKSEYLGAVNMAYAENDNRMWPYLSCQWYIDEHKKEAMVFEHLSDLLNFARNMKESGIEVRTYGNRSVTYYSRGYPKDSEAQGLFYAKDVDTYFIMWCYKAEFVKSFHRESTDSTYNYYKYTNRLMPINQFGKRIVDKDAEDMELRIVPAWIDETDDDHGRCLFLECGDMGSTVQWTEETDEEGNTTNTGTNESSGFTNRSQTEPREAAASGQLDETDYNNGALAQTKAAKAIANGEKEKTDAYYDRLYVGFYKGIYSYSERYPYPITHSVEVDDNFTPFRFPFSLSINQTREKDSEGVPMKYTYDIDNRKKYAFTFLADRIPDPRTLFFIEGSRYVCEKITATFHEGSGRSQLLKGVFYRVI